MSDDAHEAALLAIADIFDFQHRDLPWRVLGGGNGLLSDLDGGDTRVLTRVAAARIGADFAAGITLAATTDPKGLLLGFAVPAEATLCPHIFISLAGPRPRFFTLEHTTRNGFLVGEHLADGRHIAGEHLATDHAADFLAAVSARCSAEAKNPDPCS